MPHPALFFTLLYSTLSICCFVWSKCGTGSCFFRGKFSDAMLFMSLTMKDIVKWLHKPDTSKLLFAGLLCSMVFCEIYALSRRWRYKYFCPAGFGAIVSPPGSLLSSSRKRKKKIKNKISWLWWIEQPKRLDLRRTSAKYLLLWPLTWPKLWSEINGN